MQVTVLAMQVMQARVSAMKNEEIKINKKKAKKIDVYKYITLYILTCFLSPQKIKHC